MAVINSDFQRPQVTVWYIVLWLLKVLPFTLCSNFTQGQTHVRLQCLAYLHVAPWHTELCKVCNVSQDPVFPKVIRWNYAGWSVSFLPQRHFDFPVVEDTQPNGAGWLIHSKTLHSYLSLLGSSQQEETQEACCGVLQNLTANEGIVRETDVALLHQDKTKPAFDRSIWSFFYKIVENNVAAGKNVGVVCMVFCLRRCPT